MKLINFNYIPSNFKDDIINEFNNIVKKLLNKNQNMVF